MKTLKLLTLVSTTLAMCLVFNQANLAQTPVIQVNNKPQTDPMVVNGMSGGTVKTNCGNITTKPSQVIQVKESLPYLRLTVESQGKPTLFIDGPGGKFCVLADSYSENNKPELAGFWQAGQYLLYIGDLSPEQHPYALSISQKRN
ncbi:hypothetical protein H6G54_08965 [Anabaena cylindrica FACHB-243]|uniref:Uncharacterized protein n=1 Tax=Anabaena cylindrica (strain ATCC 27899 / PCC 7122) TaxID=272123 RepID=K9ZMU4_ANACC|nr:MULTISPECIES: hypothetical protein [Anabaena]AFZ60109.1 hypothetical protein Anacy_4764 [Anabaena cylindrica PCC 7122]MBD2417835.1 hypothetical protein [Anabaena cylindrica FACHB-243]MBY5283744.1 hypothetical protein [Anabaena sp. CCAP 1446/1C]MBY5307972.1 hypothetical protein [Anabaena sp. CCAP 1446/1C]MCM2404750.1 hypothetical protein [Anabaena sp. CCAP 1446/1C]